MARKPKKKVLAETKELLKLARESSQKKADKYVKLARKVAMKNRVRMPSEMKRVFCKHCYTHLKPGINARYRVHKSRVIILCQNCKRFTRVPLK